MPSPAESLAIMRQGWLIASRPARQPVRRRPGSDIAMLFVHGFLASSPVLDPMRRALSTRTGADTIAHNHFPTDDFQAVARTIAQRARAHRGRRRLVLVGHSLGGLLARYAAEVEGAPADLLITVATPHRGTDSARGVPGSMANALLPESTVLRHLGPESPLPHLSILSEDDQVIPSQSAAAEGATIHRLQGVGHNGLLFDRRTHGLMTHAVRRLRNDAPTQSA